MSGRSCLGAQYCGMAGERGGRFLKGPPRDCFVEEEYINKTWQEYTEELYTKDLHGPDNHDGVITHLDPEILKCEVKWTFSSVQFISVIQSCPTLCYPMNRSTPGLPVHHQLPEFTQTHVH